VDTSAFYNVDELEIHNNINKLHKEKKEKSIDKENKIKINKEIKENKTKLYSIFKNNIGIRQLNPKSLNKYRIISVFESALTRTLKMETNQLYDDLIVVQTYFFDIIEDIILDGFYLNGEKYVCFTASAGQIRTKKTVFIKERLLSKYCETLMCGLNLDIINACGGINVNKYLAYLALCNSATDVWNEFDINKSIVIDDMETIVHGTVDFIDDEIYKIERKIMDIPITHTDGCGMMLPSLSRKNMMCRLPWVKGLLVSFPFTKFIREANAKDPSKNHALLTDIYGVEHDVLKEDIQVIFTKSQFKMYKYYKSWDEYKNNYIKYNCTAGMCNEEEDYFEDAKINYQMIQTLTDMTDDELRKIASASLDRISKLAIDRKTMLKVFGVTEGNKNKTNLQQALEIYPELLADTYTKEILKQIKKKLVKDARSAKLDIKGKYTFIIPDLYAFCEYIFLGDKNPKGLLENGQVSCKIYKKHPKLDCLRSPHLYREHAVRNNVINSEIEKWFTTYGLYTSCHDLISKVLQFDVDGDKSLVCADETIITVAERNMKDVVPLYYKMRKAGAEKIDNKKIFQGLVSAYTGGNIGMISNDITKIWNSNNVNLDVIKLLCMENNFTIDFAKTLYKPTRPKHIKSLISRYTRAKTPHFFIYAKDKTKTQIESINDSIVNKLDKIIPNKRINFQADNLGKFNYKYLMHDNKTEINEDIIKKYDELNTKNHFTMNNQDIENSNIDYLYQEIRNKLLDGYDKLYVVDVLIKYLYGVKNSKHKETLWISFGDIIIENLKNNLKEDLENGYILCSDCGKRIPKNSNSQNMCEECYVIHRKEYYRNKKREQRRKSCPQIEIA
jgi:hypothetical protein